MDIQGRLIKILPQTEGESQRGHWVRGGFVIETDGEYPRKVCFQMFGEDRVAMLNNIPMNALVSVSFNPESREFNERWYTDLRCTRVVAINDNGMQTQSAGYNWATPQQQAPTSVQQPPFAPSMGAAPQQAAPSFAQPIPPVTESDDLPF